jgi:hypothetical protein
MNNFSTLILGYLCASERIPRRQYTPNLIVYSSMCTYDLTLTVRKYGPKGIYVAQSSKYDVFRIYRYVDLTLEAEVEVQGSLMV